MPFLVCTGLPPPSVPSNKFNQSVAGELYNYPDCPDGGSEIKEQFNRDVLGD